MPSPIAPPAAAFICGCGHSGTTLVATMLSMHSRIYVPLEETSLFLGKRKAKSRAALKALLSAAAQDSKALLVEKTPRHVRALPRIRKLAPRARLILMVRDGRDVATSIGRRYDGDYQAGIGRWIKDNTLLARELGNPLAYLLRYEDLIADPEGEMRRLCRFLGVAFEPEMLQHHQRQHLWFGKERVQHSDGVGAAHEDLRNWQVNQPIFDGRGRWKADLPAEVLAQFSVAPAKALMQRLGYGEGARPGRLSGPCGSPMGRLRQLFKQWRRAIGRRLGRR